MFESIHIKLFVRKSMKLLHDMHDKRMGLYEILPEKDTTRHKTLETMCNVRAWPPTMLEEL